MTRLERYQPLLLCIFCALTLTVIFWSPLWQGYGLIGGDLYTYYFPQKSFLVERLHDGEFPLWNNLVGHGYPLVAESQTAPFYPPHLLYGVLSLNSAYNAVQLLHYVLAFVFTWMLARKLDCSQAGSLLAALVYTYGWFPTRICLEWAIISGAWLPLAFWSVEAFFERGWWRYAILLTVALAMQMLAGHFNIAFITQTALVVYIPVRFWQKRRAATEDPSTPGEDQQSTANAPRKSALALLIAAMLLAYATSAVQLAPTWELKQISQRETIGEEHDPGYGHIPTWYLSQFVLPWFWYPRGRALDLALFASAPATNLVEAHLYFGFLPLLLSIYGMWKYRLLRDRRLILWAIVGLLALVYATGVLLPVFRYLPGFNFFRGLGRWGILTTLGVALIAGRSLTELLTRLRVPTANVLMVLLLGLTTVDFWLVGQSVTYAQLIPTPIYSHVSQSAVANTLKHYPRQPVRLFSRGANLPTILGVASTPVYLGLGPQEYYDERLRMPEPLPFDTDPTPEQVSWLQHAGVTHIVSFEPLNTRVWPARQVWAGFDYFLNPAWARREPLYLYELLGSRGRVSWLQTDNANATAEISTYRANEVSADVQSTSGGMVVLTDLTYPGWNVTVDDEPAVAITVEGMYRGVEVPPGKHHVIWRFQPASVRYGLAVTALAVFLLATVAHFRFWHPQWFERRGATKSA